MFHTIGIYFSVPLEKDYEIPLQKEISPTIGMQQIEYVSHCLSFDPVGISYHHHHIWTHPYTTPWLDINERDLDNHQNHHSGPQPYILKADFLDVRTPQKDCLRTQSQSLKANNSAMCYK